MSPLFKALSKPGERESKRLHPKERLVGLDACLVSCPIFSPFGVASVARIWDYTLGVFLKHLQTHQRFDDPEVMVVNVAGLRRRSRFYQMTGGASAGSPGFRRIVVFGMDPDGPGIGKPFVFPVTRKAKGIVVIGLGQLGSTGPSMGVVTIEAENLCIEMPALSKVQPLLVMGFGMGLRISPDSRLKLVIVG